VDHFWTFAGSYWWLVFLLGVAGGVVRRWDVRSAVTRAGSRSCGRRPN
jgi:hypothetical protein